MLFAKRGRLCSEAELVTLRLGTASVALGLEVLNLYRVLAFHLPHIDYRAQLEKKGHQP